MAGLIRKSPMKLAASRVGIWIEGLAWTCGIASLALWAGLTISGAVGTRRELHRFAAVRSIALADIAPPDRRLWSEKRIHAWQSTLQRQAPAPLAVLRIPRLGLVAPVLEGTDEWTLNRAVGHIEDTPRPGAGGNAGIAGHRDGFFRGLKDIHAGDAIEIETIGRIEEYRVERIWIVDPDDISVLDPTASPSVTLVTCYPFYFIGSTPQRFIVRAVRRDGT
jgi:sortase A